MQRSSFSKGTHQFNYVLTERKYDKYLVFCLKQKELSDKKSLDNVSVLQEQPVSLAWLFHPELRLSNTK